MSGFWLWWFLALLIWVAIAFGPARVTARKGHSFIGFFVFSLLFFPAAITVVSSSRTATRFRHTR